MSESKSLKHRSFDHPSSRSVAVFLTTLPAVRLEALRVGCQQHSLVRTIMSTITRTHIHAVSDCGCDCGRGGGGDDNRHHYLSRDGDIL